MEDQFGKRKRELNSDTFHQKLFKIACQERQVHTVELRIFNSVGSICSGYPRHDCQLYTTP